MTRSVRSDPDGDLFAAQFTQVGSAIWFRAGMVGPAYVVSAVQRDLWIRRQRRATLILVVVVVVGVLATVPLVVALAGLRQAPLFALSPEFAIWTMVGWLGLVLIVAIGVSTRAWNAPKRWLKGQAPAAPTLSRDDRRSLVVQRLRWRQVVLILFLALPVLRQVNWRLDLIRGENAFLLTVVGLHGLTALYLAGRILMRDRAARAVSAV